MYYKWDFSTIMDIIIDSLNEAIVNNKYSTVNLSLANHFL